MTPPREEPSEAVCITVPASPEYLKVLRLVAAGLAARLGFTLDQIEDLKIAVDELTAYLLKPQREGRLEIRFTVDTHQIHINGIGRFEHDKSTRTELTEMSRMILETVADSASLERMDDSPSFQLVKRK